MNQEVSSIASTLPFQLSNKTCRCEKSDNNELEELDISKDLSDHIENRLAS